MKQLILAAAVAAIGLSCATGLQAQTGDQTRPPIGGGYTNVTAIPVNDPAIKAMPEIDAKHIFLAGFSLGGYSSLLATDSKNPASYNGAVAGVIAYYTFCYDGVDPSVPVLVLIGEKDDWTPAAKCQAVTGKSNFEVVVYPGATHAFNAPSEKPREFLGHHFVYDEKTTLDAQQRTDTFMAAHMK